MLERVCLKEKSEPFRAKSLPTSAIFPGLESVANSIRAGEDSTSRHDTALAKVSRNFCGIPPAAKARDLQKFLRSQSSRYDYSDCRDDTCDNNRRDTDEQDMRGERHARRRERIERERDLWASGVQARELRRTKPLNLKASKRGFVTATGEDEDGDSNASED